jgi:hypothetical protein
VQRVRIDLGYRAREPFIPFHQRKERWAVIVAHRRAGKTVACIADLMDRALKCTKPEPRFAYLAPLYAQAKDTAWSYLKRFSLQIPGATSNESELRVDLPNGARIKLYGADGYDRLRGIYLDGVILDEFADWDPRAWTEVIRPALSDRQGWAVFIGTPKGHNELYETYNRALANPEDWFALRLKASETGLIVPAELALLRQTLAEDEYDRELETSFDAAIKGAVYGPQMKAIDGESRATTAPWEPRLTVSTAWDLGIGDSTCIWFAQQVGQEVRIIDYYEASGVGLEHYVKVLKQLPYAYDDHIVPHDADVSELGTGKRRVETMAELGIPRGRIRILPRTSVEDRINAARLLLPRCYFDAGKCERGLEALRSYQYEFDEKLKTFRRRPLHDWSSHAADAFGYLAQGLRPVRDRSNRPEFAEGVGELQW